MLCRLGDKGSRGVAR